MDESRKYEKNILALGWIIELDEQISSKEAPKLHHSFFTTSLQNSTIARRVDIDDDFECIEITFFSGEETIRFAFIWSRSELWPSIRERLRSKGIKAPHGQKNTSKIIVCYGAEDECSRYSRIRLGNVDKDLGAEVTGSRGYFMLCEEKGFSCYSSKRKEVISHWLTPQGGKEGECRLHGIERYAMVFALGKAYEKVVERFLSGIADVLVGSADGAIDYDKLELLRESTVTFNARYLFQSPVPQKRGGMYGFSKNVIKVMHFNCLYEEMNEQLEAINQVVSNRRLTEQYEHQRTMERKMGRVSVGLAIFAVILTLFDLLIHPPTSWLSAIQSWVNLF